MSTANSIRVMHGKGRRARTVAIEPRAWAVLELWLAARRERGIPRSAPVFCTLAGRPLSSRYVRWLMADLGAKAQIGKRVHAHGLRHTRLAEMAREGIPVHIISRAAGHSNVATTDRYIMHLNPQMVLDAMLGSQWGRDDDELGAFDMAPGQ